LIKTIFVVITILSLAACATQAVQTQAPATKPPTAVATMPFAHTACAKGVNLTGQTVSLHHILALVGEQNDTFLQPLKAGFDDATEYFNTHGGICGATLAQVFANTDMSPQSIYDRDMALKPKPVMVVLYASGDAEDLRNQLAKDEVPALGIRVGSILALYGEDGQTPGWIFGTNPLYVEQVGAMCDYIAAHAKLFPKPSLGFISWDDGWAHSADTAESRAYCQSVGVNYAGASYFTSDATNIQPQVQNLISAGANILYTNSLDTGPGLVAKTLVEMGLQGKVTLAAVNWAMDPTVGLLGAMSLRADGLPAMNGMIGSLPLRSWTETDQPGIKLITEQADLHKRPQQVRNNYYTLAWASTDLYIETYIQTGNRVGFDHITGAEIKKTLENIIYTPLGGVEKIDFQGGARRTLSADRIGQMDYLGVDGKTPAGPNNLPMLITIGGQQNMVPMLVPLSDFGTAPDLRPGGASALPATRIAPTSTP
jgi:ABC-type branched-subunit amino acid transport system substrate-binding protein